MYTLNIEEQIINVKQCISLLKYTQLFHQQEFGGRFYEKRLKLELKGNYYVGTC